MSKRPLPRKVIRTRLSEHAALQPVRIKSYTGHDSGEWRKAIPTLRKGYYVVDPTHVGGEAPKDFLRVYEYEGAPVLRANPATWPAYVAKVGHKHYPAESATEQLMTRTGQLCQLDVAESRLMICGGQLRFLSRYFLRTDAMLNHGAEILGRYLQDPEFVQHVAEGRGEKDLFTFQAYRTAIERTFPDQAEDILRGFVRMIGFDALVGNQDRHSYNWGVITHTRGAVVPRFAPIYDTARGLFWNMSEEGLTKFETSAALDRYIARAEPLISWDGHSGHLNHFDLVERIATADRQCRTWLEELGQAAMGALKPCLGMVDAEFSCLLSARRREAIQRCLQARFERFASIF